MQPYTLRTVTPRGIEINQSLGNEYTIVKRQSIDENSETFIFENGSTDKSLQEFLHEQPKDIFGVVYGQNHETYEFLKESCKYYIVGERGQTICAIKNNVKIDESIETLQ